MKKKFVFIICVVLILVCALAGCNKADHSLDNHISYEQTASYVGENPNYSVIVEVGDKEKIFVADGKTIKVVPFMTIKIFEKQTDNSTNALKYDINVNGKSEKGDIKKDKFTKYYDKTINVNGDVKYIKIIKDDKFQEITLSNQIKGKLSSREALKIAEKELAISIEEGWKEDNFVKEIYIKFVRYNNDIKAATYWFVSIIDENNNSTAVLIDPTSGEVVTTKK